MSEDIYILEATTNKDAIYELIWQWVEPKENIESE